MIWTMFLIWYLECFSIIFKVNAKINSDMTGVVMKFHTLAPIHNSGIIPAFAHR